MTFDYKDNNMSTDREKGRGNKRARLTRGSRNPRHGKRNGTAAANLKFKISKFRLCWGSLMPKMWITYRV
jgi:hypothetical protein